MSNFTLHYNERAQVWIAKYRNIGATQWKTKWLPKAIKAHRETEAHAWFITWYATFLRDGLGIPANEVRPVKTLRTLFPMWLALRKRRIAQSSHNYYKLIKSAGDCWILDHPSHSHVSIECLDLERDFSTELVRNWIHSIHLAPGTVLGIAGVLRNFFSDMLEEERLDPSIANPLQKRPIVRELKQLRARKDKGRKIDGEKVVTVLNADQANTLINARHPKVPAIRRIAYLVTTGTGVRDNELRALMWSDLHLDEEVPYVHITKQLLKPGILPALRYETERESGRERDEIMVSPRAVFSDPKFDEVRKVPLHPAVVAGLCWWKRTGWKRAVGANPRDCDPIFPRDARSSVPGIFAHSQSAPLLRQDLARLGLPTTCHGKPLVFHSLRHTTGSMLKAAGVALDDVGELLGHANAGNVTRDHYIDVRLSTVYDHVCKLPLVFDDLTSKAHEHEKKAG
jgi:integrase